MEPTRGPVAWGRPAWSFLHGITLDPLASKNSKRAQKRVLESLRYILPCPTCRESYRRFSRALNQVAADQMGEWVVDLHDRVNLKLDKPAGDTPAVVWKAFQLQQFAEEGYASYVEDMFFFFFTLAANYPLVWTENTQIAEKYRDFFQAVPQAVAHRPWGRKMMTYMEKNPLSDEVLSGGREALMKWVYDMYIAVIPPQMQQSLETVQETMDVMRKM